MGSKGRMGMEIGKPQRVFHIEPAEDPIPRRIVVPEEETAPDEAPIAPEREHVPA